MSGAGNRVLEEFTKEMRVLVEEGSLSKGSHRVYRGAIRRYMEWARVSELMAGGDTELASETSDISTIPYVFN